jgi:hypothetical protein
MRSNAILCRPYPDSVSLLRVPGTPVPGYRLFRPYGTGAVVRDSLDLPWGHCWA